MTFAFSSVYTSFFYGGTPHLWSYSIYLIPYTAKYNKFNLWGKTVQITAGNDDIKKRKAEPVYLTGPG